MSMIKTKWDLSLLLSGAKDEEETLIETIEKRVTEFESNWKDGEYLNDVATLKEALEQYEEWLDKYAYGSKVAFFYSLACQLKLGDPKLKARTNQIDEKAVAWGNRMQFFELNLAKIEPKKQKQFLSNPTLARYHYFLKRLFELAKYMLSEPEEKILNLKSKTSHSNWVQMTEESLDKEERGGKNFAQLSSLISVPDKTVRDESAAAIDEILEKYRVMAEHEMNSILANKKVDDELRGLKRPDSARLMSDDVEVTTIDTMRQVVTESFGLATDFYKFKTKLLGLGQMKYHERQVPYGKTEVKYEYQEGVKIVKDTFEWLDPEFGEIFNRFTEGGNIDVFPGKDRSAGVYCAHFLRSQPTYIMLNYTNRLRDVTTLAHEAGHGINNELIKKSQGAMYFGSSLAVAEVASTFMEDWVLEAATKSVDDEMALEIRVAKLNDDMASIFRQVAAYNFEWDLHRNFREKGYLSANVIGEIFGRHMNSYLGNKIIECSPGSQNWWIYWTHFRNFFYVYSYASGLLISKALQREVKKDHKFINKVKTFLSTGLSESPKTMFAKMGIDIDSREFWQSGIEEIKCQLEETKKLAEKLGKV